MSESTEAHDLDEEQRAAHVDTLSSWLIHNGAPRFTPRYSARALLPELATAFSFVLGFEITTAAWLPISGSALVILPALLAASLIAARLTLRWRGRRSAAARRRRRVVRLVVTVVAVTCSALTLTLLPVLFLVETVVIALCVRLAFILTVGGTEDGAISLRQRRNLVLLCTASIALTPLMGQLWRWTVFYPVHTLLGLLVAVCAVNLARGSARSSDRDVSDRWTYATASTGPLLVVVACQWVVLPYFGPTRGALSGIALCVAVLAVVGGAIWTYVQGARRRRGRGRCEWGRSVWLLVWATLFVLAYPVVFASTVHRGYHAAIDVPLITWGEPVEAALFALSVNVAYSMLAFALVAVAVDRMATWIFSRLRVVRSVTQGLSAQLALILIATTFFLFAAETWEVVVETPREAEWRFWALVGALLLIAFAFLTSDARTLIEQNRHFTSEKLKEAVSQVSELEMRTEEQRAAQALLARGPAPNTADITLAMNWRRWINALLFVYFYQALIFLTLMALSAITLWVIATVAVSPDVALTWVCGDEAAAVEEPDPSTPLGKCAEAVQGEARDTPWTRVALLLAAFATLERVIRTTTDSALHDSVFGPAERELRLRFATAVLLDHQEGVEPRTPSATGPPAQRRGPPSRVPDEGTELNA